MSLPSSSSSMVLALATSSTPPATTTFPCTTDRQAPVLPRTLAASCSWMMASAQGCHPRTLGYIAIQHRPTF